MITFSLQDGDELHYTVSGRISAGDLHQYYRTVRAHYRRYGRLRLLAQTRGFAGYAGWRALVTFLRHEPTLLWRVRRYALVTDQRWLRRSVRLLRIAAPATVVRAFPGSAEAAALAWLRHGKI